MTRQIKDIVQAKEGFQSRGFFLVSDLEIRKTRQGSDYASLLLKDSTGSMAAKIWQERLPLLEKRGIRNNCRVMAEVKVRTYKGRVGVEIINIRPIEEQDRKEGFEDSMVETWAPRDVDEMFAELLTLVDTIEKPPLRELVLKVLHSRSSAFRSHPAARRIHHAYRGGLLEHTLMVTRSALALGTMYNGAYPLGVNRDVLLAAAVLHDIGKIDEIDPDNRETYTIAGNLVGHIVLGHRAVMAAANETADLDERDLLHLEHLFLSHHGRKEWGAVQEPKTAEAIILHYADDCDAKLNIFFGALEKDRAEGDFTPFHEILGRPLYKKGVLEQPEPESPGEQTHLDL